MGLQDRTWEISLRNTAFPDLFSKTVASLIHSIALSKAHFVV